MKKNALIQILVLVTLVAGCAPNDRTATLNLSTPEDTFKTAFQAAKNKQYDVALDAMTIGYQQNFGATRQDQLKTLKSSGDLAKFNSEWRRVIKRVDYGPFTDGFDAKVIYDDFSGQRLIFKDAVMPMMKEAGLWKIAGAKLEKINASQMLENNEILASDVVLDEKNKTWSIAKKSHITSSSDTQLN
jgi:hypothetical protein